eukprot:240861_1
MTRVAIIGTGDLAYDLAHLYSINNSSSYSEHTLEVTKPNLRNDGFFHDTKVSQGDFDDVLARADVLIFAIPSVALSDFVAAHERKLTGKILVDVTNSYKPNQDLSSTLNRVSISDRSNSNSDESPLKTDCFRWVKAFNDIGAVDILLRKPGAKTKIASKMCGNSKEALDTVKSFAEASMGFDIKVVPIEQYEAIKNDQNSLGTEWITASFTIMGVFMLTMVYNIIRHPIKKGYPWKQFPLFVMNKSICWTALWGFAIAQVPGVIARIDNAWHRNTLRDKPKWLRNYLACRKHLGLVSLWFLAVHIVMSCLMFGIGYYDRFFTDPDDPKSRMTANGESSFMFGSFGSCLYFVLGICSLPSVAEAMTRKQWDFVYGPVAWTALCFGTAHVMCQGIGVTWYKAPWPNAGEMPPITLISCLLPWFVIGFKIFQMVFVRILNFSAKKKEADGHWA